MNNFKYWPRYVSRVLKVNAVYRGDFMKWKIDAAIQEAPTQRDFEQSEKRNHPLWKYSESYPWNMANRLSQFPFPDIYWTINYSDKKKVKSKLSFFNSDENIIFKGDRVQVLVGPDKGKNGIVASLIKMRNLVIVEGLNCIYVKPDKIQQIMKRELPLHIKTEVSLIDPQDNNICEVEWRYNDQGKRVRVSTRTGRIIPMPTAAEALDDGTIPSRIPPGPNDTLESDVLEVTYKPVLRTFTEDIFIQNKVKDQNPRAKTFWY